MSDFLLPPGQRYLRRMRAEQAERERRDPSADPARRVIPSPNIWNDADIYEVENRSVDPEQAIEATMRRLAGVTSFAGLRLVDIGCGSGFHLPRWAAEGAQVTGVEPHAPLVARARERVARLGIDVVVHHTGAQSMPLPDASVDIAHARWAYFFGPGCEPGLDELDRVMAPGGTAFIIDNDTSTSTFARWFTTAYPTYDPAATERFFRRHGWAAEPVLMRWEMTSRADFEAVVRIEFPPEHATAFLDEDPTRTSVDYAVLVRHKRY